jgi:hypothetical protein
MISYKIVKSSRSDDSPPYAGLTCDRAGIEPGKIYYYLSTAENFAARLAAKNPVGFKVVTMGTGKTDQDILEIVRDLTSENGRHYFDPFMVAKIAGEPLLEVQQCFYRLTQYGKVGIIPFPPSIDEANRITSVCLGSEERC